MTGATGFVGGALVNKLLLNGYEIAALVKERSAALASSVEQKIVGNLTEDTDFTSILQPNDIVIHVAGRAHIMYPTDTDEELEAFRKVNTAATLNLARQSAASGTKRFIFISSIGVNGNQTENISKKEHANHIQEECSGRGGGFTDSGVFRETDIPNPHNAYSLSKWEAEQGLMEISRETGMEVVIIRPPLVYGPGVKGNFASMIHWLKKSIPLPLGAIDNRRSLVAVDNLVNFIELCMWHPRAANETFLIADGEDVSTTELLRRVANALGKKLLLIPVPVSWLTFFAKLLGKQAKVEQLLGSLQVDITKARELLDWRPPISMQQQLANMAEWEVSRQHSK